MLIYVNTQSHYIEGVRVRPEYDIDKELKEVEVPDDFIGHVCDTVIKSYCYHEWTDEHGNQCLSIYPYKDLGLLQSIQEQDDIRENQLIGTQKASVDLDLRVTLLEYDTYSSKNL